MKPQTVRLLDVFVIGPVMIAGGNAWAAKNPAAGMLLALFGVGTVIYNGKNYLEVRNRDQTIR